MEYSNYFGRCKVYVNNNLINSENLLFLSMGIEKYITITNFYKQNNFIKSGDNLKIEKHFYNVYPDEMKGNKKEIYNCNILEVNGKDILKIKGSKKV